MTVFPQLLGDCNYPQTQYFTGSDYAIDYFYHVITVISMITFIT